VRQAPAKAFDLQGQRLHYFCEAELRFTGGVFDFVIKCYASLPYEYFDIKLIIRRPTPPLYSNTPGSSVGSSKSGSGSGSDRGLWMRDSKNAGKQGTDEQIGVVTPELRVIPPTPLLNISTKSRSCSTIRASRVNPPAQRGEEDVTMDDQIAEWMKGNKCIPGRVKESEEEKVLQADF